MSETKQEYFTYSDVVLYAKYWYERNDLIDDLGYIFSNIFGWKSDCEHEIAQMMLMALDAFYEKVGIQLNRKEDGFWNNSFESFYRAIRERATFDNNSYDRAVIKHVLSILSRSPKDALKKLNIKPPHFGKKEHFRMNGKQSMTYKEMNRIAKETFSE